MRCVAILYVIIWTTILLSTSMVVIIGCFWVYGITSAIHCIISYAYIGEVTSPKNRELIGVVYNAASAIGTISELSLSSFFAYYALAAFPLCVSVLALLVSSYMVESPYYLVSSGKNEPALRNLRYLNDRQGENEVLADLETVRAYVNEQTTDGQPAKRKLHIALTPANLKSSLVMILVCGFSTMHSSTLITNTGPFILKDFKQYVNGITFVSAFASARGLLQLCSIFTIKRFDRRTLFLVGYPLCGLLQLACGLCFHIESQNGNAVGWLARVIACLLAAHQIFMCLTFGVALEILKMEIFPYKLKEFYSSLILCTGDWFIFLQIQSYFSMEPTLGNSFLLASYTICSLVTVFMIYFFIQDTKGKTLLQIRTDLNGEFRSNVGDTELESLRC